MADTKVKAIVSHSQEIDGKQKKAGDEVTLDPQLARVLASRGGIHIKSEREAAKIAPATTKEATK